MIQIPRNPASPFPTHRACRRARACQGQALRVAAKTRPALTAPALGGFGTCGRGGRMLAARVEQKNGPKTPVGLSAVLYQRSSYTNNCFHLHKLSRPHQLCAPAFLAMTDLIFVIAMVVEPAEFTPRTAKGRKTKQEMIRIHFAPTTHSFLQCRHPSFPRTGKALQARHSNTENTWPPAFQHLLCFPIRETRPIRLRRNR